MISLLLNRGSHQRQNLPYVKQVLLCPPEASQEQVEYRHLKHLRVMFKNQSHPPHPPRPIPVEQQIGRQITGPLSIITLFSQCERVSAAPK